MHLTHDFKNWPLQRLYRYGKWVRYTDHWNYTGKTLSSYWWNCKKLKTYVRDFQFINIFLGTSLVVQWFRVLLPGQGVWVRSLVGELRSHMLRSQKTKTKNRSNVETNSTKTLKLVHVKKKKKSLKTTTKNRIYEYIS